MRAPTILWAGPYYSIILHRPYSLLLGGNGWRTLACTMNTPLLHADPPVPVACLNYACPTIRERPQPIELKGARHPAGRGMHVNLVQRPIYLGGARL